MSERHTMLERQGFWAGTVKSSAWDLWYGLIEVDGVATWGTCYFDREDLAADSVREYLNQIM